MASKRAQRRRACTGKRAYPDHASAGRAAAGARETFGEYLVPYRCSFCRQFHVGHPPRTVARAIADNVTERARLRAAA